MDGGFCLIIHPGAVNSQFKARHFSTEQEARDAAAQVLAEKSGTHFVMIVPSIYFERGSEAKARQAKRDAKLNDDSK